MARAAVCRAGSWISTVLLVILVARAYAAEEQSWVPLTSESTLEVLTVDHAGLEHWSKFWWVVIEGQVYLRLGSRGAARLQSNRNSPFISVKIAGQRFDDVRVIDTPEMAQRVAEAMAEKYWADLFIRWFPHPLTVRLERGV